jgi:hypothetical protein
MISRSHDSSRNSQLLMHRRMLGDGFPAAVLQLAPNHFDLAWSFDPNRDPVPTHLGNHQGDIVSNHDSFAFFST